MITLENRFFPLRCAACFLAEGGIIFLSVLFSFLILSDYGPPMELENTDILLRGVLIAIFCQTCMYFLDMYDLRNSHDWKELFFSLVFSIGVVCLGVGTISYAIPSLGTQGAVYYLTISFAGIFLLVWRIVFDYYLSHHAPRENILVVGDGCLADLLGKEILARERLGFHLAGTLSLDRYNALPGTGDDSARRTISVIVKERNIAKVVVAIENRRGTYPTDELLALKSEGCKIIEGHEFIEKLTGRILVDSLSPSYFIFGKGFQKHRVVLFIRRAISLLVSLTLLIPLFPFLILIAIAIKLDSKGPILYSQERVGKSNRTFRIYKFRSMKQDAEAPGVAQWAQKDDPRITRLGHFLRISRLDEIPQLINVIKGDIDLVGPRPERPVFVQQLVQAIPFYSLRHTVNPGLTGWAQVMFTYCGSIEESREKLQYDLFYIKNMSVKLDLLIIFRTIKIVILGRGAR